jgi:hypothetical protein
MEKSKLDDICKVLKNVVYSKRGGAFMLFYRHLLAWIVTRY